MAIDEIREMEPVYVKKTDESEMSFQEQLTVSNYCELTMTFGKENGEDMNITYKYAKKTAGNANVKSLMEGIIANGSIFEKKPVTIKSAYFKDVQYIAVDLS